MTNFPEDVLIFCKYKVSKCTIGIQSTPFILILYASLIDHVSLYCTKTGSDVLYVQPLTVSLHAGTLVLLIQALLCTLQG